MSATEGCSFCVCFFFQHPLKALMSVEPVQEHRIANTHFDEKKNIGLEKKVFEHFDLECCVLNSSRLTNFVSNWILSAMILRMIMMMMMRKICRAWPRCYHSMLGAQNDENKRKPLASIFSYASRD